MKAPALTSSIFTASLIALLSHNAHAEFSGTWEQELAVGIDGSNTKGQKFEAVLEPEWNTSLSDNIDMTVIARMRLDAYDKLGYEGERLDNYSSINGPLVEGSHGDIDIRELYVDTELFNTFWRIGKQQVVWGQADGLKVLDVVNPQSYREFILDDFADSRIPLWILNVEVPVTDNDSIQILWVPDTTYNEFAAQGTVYELTSPLLVPQLVDGITLTGINEDKPSGASDGDMGIRYSKFYDGWDLTFNYMYHYNDNPVFYQSVVGAEVTIDAIYERNNLIGATASKAFGSFTLRTEIGYSSDIYHLIDNTSSAFVENQGVHESDELSSVIGLDYQGIENTMLSMQWFQSIVFDYEDYLIRPEDNNILSWLYKQTFQNETWVLDVLALYGLDQDDSSIQLQLSYMLESNIKLWAGGDVFTGPSESLLGQFDHTDRVLIGFEWGI
ncbi:MAG: hypothetical protein HRU20_23185 [Pseudomonadales bacterium]|nr:hypothetical protein [Pseudomonadales bacterium]